MRLNIYYIGFSCFLSDKRYLGKITVSLLRLLIYLLPMYIGIEWFYLNAFRRHYNYCVTVSIQLSSRFISSSHFDKQPNCTESITIFRHTCVYRGPRILLRQANFRKNATNDIRLYRLSVCEMRAVVFGIINTGRVVENTCNFN